MSLLRPPRQSPDPLPSGALHELAQQKVQAALAGLSKADPAADTADPIVAQALERMQAHLGELTAVDQWGRPVTWAQVARLVIGPLAGRMRDADTAGALMDALNGSEPEPAPPVAEETPSPVPTQPEHVKAKHLTLDGGGQRYVFSHEERLEEFSDRPSLLDSMPDEQARDLEERLLVALERRFPDPPPTPARIPQGLGWPEPARR